jgi:hypothetical protein
MIEIEVKAVAERSLHGSQAYVWTSIDPCGVLEWEKNEVTRHHTQLSNQ